MSRRQLTSIMAKGEPNPLISLFRQCVVRISDGGGKFRGTGFFVAPGRVVTCAHLVYGSAELRVWWRDRLAPLAVVAEEVPPFALAPDSASYPLPDLALLDVAGAEEWGHPCVKLMAGHRVLDGSPIALYLAGYSIEHGGSSALTGAVTEFESEVHEGPHTLYKLKRGLLLREFSGSPILDLQAGTVAGIVASRQRQHGDLGGFAVPADALREAFPDAAEANLMFHQVDDRWKTAVEAENVAATERAGQRARLRLRPAVVRLAPGEEVSAATLLRPRHAVVGYVGHEQLLNDLAAWCEQEPMDAESAELWFVTGGGGFGKTRLAIQACLEAEARGWTAGLLPPDLSDSDLEALAVWPGRLLIVVDYAETRPALVGRLVEELEAHSPRLVGKDHASSAPPRYSRRPGRAVQSSARRTPWRPAAPGADVPP